MEERNRVLDYLLDLASSDSRVVGAAIVGSLANGDGDQWSDIDLTFSLADGVPVAQVLDDWTRRLAEEFDAVKLIDLESRGTTYRVFLLPSCLQLDLSFTPAPELRKGSDRFKLVFGTFTTDYAPPPSADDLFGWAVGYALWTRMSIERGKSWQAEYLLSALRDTALTLACLRRDLPTGFGKGLDQLPADVLDAFEGALVRSLDRDELLDALRNAVTGLLDEAAGVSDLVAKVEPQLRELASNTAG